MVKRAIRTAMGASALSVGLLACAQLIGLEDTKDRLAASIEDAGDSGNVVDGVDAGDSGQMNIDAAVGDCAHHTDCVTRYSGKPGLCVRDKGTPPHCVQVSDTLCRPQVFPSNAILKDDNALIIPAFIPQKASLASDPSVLAPYLALNELAASGIPLDNNVTRPVGMIFCASDKALAHDAVDHVVNQLKLPAIIAGFGADDLTIFVRTITRPAGVFVLNPSVAPEALKYDTTRRDLFWSLLGTTEDVALAYQPLVGKVTALVKAKHGGKAGDGTDKVKIALINTDTPGEIGAANVIEQGKRVDDGGIGRDPSFAISVNGSFPDTVNDPDGGQFYVEQFGGSEQLPQVKLPDGLVDRIANFHPDIIIALTSVELPDLVRGVDQKIFAMDGASRERLPFWVLGQRNAHVPDALKYFKEPALGELFSDRVQRFLGIQYAGTVGTPDQAEHDEWLKRMDKAYKPNDGGARPSDYTASENFYDAVYWIAYGLFAGRLGNPSVTLSDSDAIGAGVRYLVNLNGAAIRPGPDNIDSAFGALRMKEVDLADHQYVGALGQPNIEPRFGTWRNIGATYCYPLPDDPKAVVQPTYDTQRYNAVLGTLDDVVIPDDAGGHKIKCPFNY